MLLAATFLSLSGLRAQDAASTAPSADMDSGSDATALPDEPPAPAIMAPTTPDEAQSMEENLYGAGEAQNDAPAEPDAQSRPWKLNFHAGIDSRYDSNVFISSTHAESDVLTDLIAGAGFTLGDYTAKQSNYLVADYTGIGELFARYTSEDAYNQKASMETQLVLAHLTLRADFNFEDVEEDNIDIGTRAQEELYNGHVSARYDISDKTYLEATGQVAVSDYERYINSNDERGGISLDYLPDPSVTIGVGATAGALHVENSASQTYEQLLASLKIDFTDKFTLSASAGGEARQTDSKDIYTPVLDLTIDYKPFQELDLSLSAFRQVENSASFAGSDFTSTGVNASVRYDISARFALMLQGGYANCDYREVSPGLGVNRTDNYLFVRPAFRYIASPNCNIELYYFYRDNESTLSHYTFTDTQVGGNITFTY
jgi:hypothetical protein